MPQPLAARLEALFDAHEIDLRRGALFDLDLDPLPPDFDWSRVDGMLAGLAIGDALGFPTEGMAPAERRAVHGEVRDFLVLGEDRARAGGPSDETQTAFRALEDIVHAGRFRPDRVAARWAEAPIFGISPTLRDFLKAYRAGNMPWARCGAKAPFADALARVPALLVPHLRQGGTALWPDVALGVMMSHDDSAAIAAGLAYAALLRDLLVAPAPPPPAWWAARFVAAAADCEIDPHYRARVAASEPLAAFQGTLCDFVGAVLPDALARDLSAAEACAAWGGGAYVLEAVPSALYILARHAAAPEEAMVRAVNDVPDADTVGALVGAAVGALHGLDALPERWRRALPGRIGADDDGAVWRLIAAARARWGDASAPP